MDKFVTLSTTPPVRPGNNPETPRSPPGSQGPQPVSANPKVQVPIRGLTYDLDLLVNDKKYKPHQIEELSDQVSQGSQSSHSKHSIHSKPDNQSQGSQQKRRTRADRQELKPDLSQKRGEGFSDNEIENLINRHQDSLSKPVKPATKPNVIEIPTDNNSRLQEKLNDLVISDDDDEESESYHEKRYRDQPQDYNRLDDESSHSQRKTRSDRHGSGETRHGSGNTEHHESRTTEHHESRTAEPERRNTEQYENRNFDYNDNRRAEHERRSAEYDNNDVEDDNEPIDMNDETNLSHQQILGRKRQLMIRSARLKKQGYPPATTLNMTMSMQEMKEIVEIQREERSLENSIRLQGDILTGAVSGVEKLNHKFDPADLHLDGWSESFYENIDNYDEVFEDLYYKYSEKVHVEPEIKLIGMVLGSGMAFHYSKSVMDKAGQAIPGFEQIMSRRPDLANAYRQEALNMMSQPHGMPPFHPYMNRNMPPGGYGPPPGPPSQVSPGSPPRFPPNMPPQMRPPQAMGPPMGPPPQMGIPPQAMGPPPQMRHPPQMRPPQSMRPPTEPQGVTPMGAGAPAHAGAGMGPGPSQVGGGHLNQGGHISPNGHINQMNPTANTGFNPMAGAAGMNPMANMLGNLTGNPYLGGLLNNIMSGGGDDSEENGDPKRSDFRQRRMAKKADRKKPQTNPGATSVTNKYPKVFNQQSSDVQDVDDLLAGILPPMPATTVPQETRKTRRDRSQAVN